MTQRQEETIENTEYPETVEPILNYDKGASDAVFEFFIEIGSCAVVPFFERNLHEYKGNALRAAYSEVNGNSSLQNKL